MLNGMNLPALLIALALALVAVALVVAAVGIVARDEGKYSEREK